MIHSSQLNSNKTSYNMNRFLRDLTIGTAATSTYIACRAFKKENRGDTFVKTAKKCLKSYTSYNRGNYSELAKILKLNKLSNWINNIGNKKLCVALFAGGAVFEGLFFGTIWDWTTKR